MNNIKTGYGRRVAILRKASGLSQRAFAQAVLSDGASARNIGRIEAELVRPRLSTLARIAAATGADLRWLARGELAQAERISQPFVGARLRDLRESLGLSQRAFAKLALSAKASAKNIGRIENGEVMPRQVTLERLAEKSSQPLSYFLHAA